MNYTRMKAFYKNRKILVTGHTGFKGTWLCQVLKEFGADVIGYALKPPTEPSLYRLIAMDKAVTSYIGDIRDLEYLKSVFEREHPEIVIHMAAQPLVRESYANPVGTYEINVMGTVHILECVRMTPSVKSVVNVTTDKVYRNNEWEKGYIETDVLDGYDPYSNSKSCSELVTHSYVQAFLQPQGVSVSTCRAGNVIGGGDFAGDRIIPDCVRTAERLFYGRGMEGGHEEETAVVVRNPYSTRPYQHVLEPLYAYLLIAMEQYENHKLANCYNVGPDDNNCVTTGELTNLFCKLWNEAGILGGQAPLSWIDRSDGGPHEADFLKLDCTKLKRTFGWRPKWSIEETLQKVVEWERLRMESGRQEDAAEKLRGLIVRQMEAYSTQ